MPQAALNRINPAIFPRITERLKMAGDAVDVARKFAASGNQGGAMRMLCDVAELIPEVTALLEAAERPPPSNTA